MDGKKGNEKKNIKRQKNFTLYSSITAARTLTAVSIPSSSSGKCKGKSTSENLVWSGKANSSIGTIFNGIT